jgi:VanZ family protein
MINSIGLDKFAHFGVSFALQFVFTTILVVVGFDPRVSVLLAAPVTLGIGIAKETGDMFSGGTADRWDMVANGAGILLAMVATYVFTNVVA